MKAVTLILVSKMMHCTWTLMMKESVGDNSMSDDNFLWEEVDN